MVQIKFGQKLWGHFFKISIFWYQLRDYFNNMDCNTFGSIFAIFDLSANKQYKKKNYFISMVQIKFGQKLWNHFFKISTFWCQSRDPFKNVDCSTPSLIFDKFNLLANKRPLKMELFYIDGSNHIWIKVIKPLLPNINILISAKWPKM